MWCTQCQADVAGEMTPDHRRILCASCGSPVQKVPGLAAEDKTRQARELLQRWSQNRWSDLAEDPEPAADAETDPTPAAEEDFPAGPAVLAGPTVRADQPQPPPTLAPEKAPPVNRSASETLPLEKPLSPPQSAAAIPRPSRPHHPHGTSAPAPHFSGDPLPIEESSPQPSSSSRLQAFWGQMLAYAGVLALTIGAVFVLLGYFGGPQWQSYTPTGWLITTTGQMLLFLGVVTLVSGGMEQTTEEVARRIDSLSQRIIRIEWASQQALKDPSRPAEPFTEPEERPTAKDNEPAEIAA